MPGKAGSSTTSGASNVAPGMTVEVAAEHLAVFGPAEERDRGAMDADEAFAVVADERDQVRLLRVVHVEIAVGEERDGVIVIQVPGLILEGLLGDGRAVGPEGGVPSARVSAQVVEGDHGGRDRLVLVSLALTDDQQVPLLLLGEGASGRLEGEGQDDDVPHHFHEHLPEGRHLSFPAAQRIALCTRAR